MPELPEVETIRRGLTTWMVGKRIRTVTVLWPPSIDAPRTAINRLRNKTVNSVRRRGKALVLDLDGGLHVLLHPMMTGQLVVVDHAVTVFAGGHPSRSMLATMPNATTRVVLGLSEGTVVYFNDQRKFGWIRILDTAALRGDPFLARLGPEPLDAQFTVERLPGATGSAPAGADQGRAA